MAQLKPDELQALQKLMASAQRTTQPRIAGVENETLNHAVAHLFERKSVVPEHELLNVALSRRPGEVDLPTLKLAVQHSAELVQTERGFSTRQILATELDLIKAVNAGCDSVGPLHSYRPADWLGEDQQRAIYHVLRTGDRITGLRGLAVRAKPRRCASWSPLAKRLKSKPLFCAPTAAATDVLRKEGFEAVTLQKLLQSKPAVSEKVWWCWMKLEQWGLMT